MIKIHRILKIKKLIKKPFHKINKPTMEKEDVQFWKKPEINENTFKTGLKVNNTLWRDEKTEFIPKDGRRVNWYICGPTVYSHSHLGHAKTYLCFDTIRKIMTRYFKYDVFQVMNITDIDDKIIKNSKEQGRDFFEFGKFWEKDFFEICQMLEIDPPNVITRVTEFVPEVVEYINKIIDNGFAYESNGSVYFNVPAFIESGKVYPRLRTMKLKNEIETEEKEKKEKKEQTEEKNTKAPETNEQSEKKDKRDFALWKNSKPGEPNWESPWGKGRPGWHIECSVMCSAELPTPVDIHTGGEDLKFPHHDNEIAQSEAHDMCEQWMNYFLHTGHMHIKGRKMSKSLKNFITIRNIIKTVPPKVLRIYYNLVNYDALLNYNPKDDFVQARGVEKTFREFLQTCDFHLKYQNEKILGQSQKLNQAERDIFEDLRNLKLEIHEALCDNFGVPKVLLGLQKFISSLNGYIKENDKNSKFTVLKTARDFVSEMLWCLGLDYTTNNSSDNENKVIDTFVKMRNDIREIGKKTKNTELLKVSDKYRETMIKEFSIKIEDATNIWKRLDAEDIERELNNKTKQKKTKQNEKEQNEDEVKFPECLFTEFGSLNKYKNFKMDDQGLPFEDPNGKPISKKNRKYVEKVYKKQKQKYDEDLKTKSD